MRKQKQRRVEAVDFAAIARMSGSELAREVGLSRQRVSQLKKQGYSNAEIASRRGLGTTTPTASSSAPSGTADVTERPLTFAEARALKERLLARKHQLDLAVREGGLIPVSKAIILYGTRIVNFRNAMLAIPDFADQLAGESAVRIRFLLDQEIRGALARLGNARTEELRNA
jgi:biotin operon repressor